MRGTTERCHDYSRRHHRRGTWLDARGPSCERDLITKDLRIRSLTAPSQTGELTPDLGAHAGQSEDPDLRVWTHKDSPDTRHRTTDQKVAGLNSRTAPETLSACHTHATGQSALRSLAVTHGHRPTVYLVLCCRSSASDRATDLPSWSCGFDSRRPLCFLTAHRLFSSTCSADCRLLPSAGF
jgi:hypothetical protein